MPFLNTYQRRQSKNIKKYLRYAPMTGHNLIYVPPFKWPYGNEKV